MRWIHFTLVSLICVQAAVQQTLTAYLRVKWPNVSLSTIENNEHAIRAALLEYFPMNLSANIHFLEIRAANTDVTQTQNFTIEVAIQGSTTNEKTSSYLVALMNQTTAPTLNDTITNALSVKANLDYDFGVAPSAQHLQIAPTPASLEVFALNASYILTNLRYFSSSNTMSNTTVYSGNYFSLAALTRMRYAFYNLLSFHNDGYEDASIMRVLNITSAMKTETDVLVFVRLNTTSRNMSTSLAKIKSGALADIINLDLSGMDISLVVDVPWQPPSSQWWTVDSTIVTDNSSNSSNTTMNNNTNYNNTIYNNTYIPSTTNTPNYMNTNTPSPTNDDMWNTITFPPRTTTPSTPLPTAPLPTSVIPMLDGGLISYPWQYHFGVTNMSFAPMYRHPGHCLPNNRFCVHLKWIIDSADTYILARIKGQEFINSTLLASVYGPAIDSVTTSIWTLYDISPSNIYFDFIRTGDNSLLTVDLAANLINTNSAISTVTSTSNKEVYVSYNTTPISSKELVLEIHLINGSPPTRKTRTMQDEGCAYCFMLATQCDEDPSCFNLRRCMNESTSEEDKNKLIHNGDYGDSLNTTKATSSCLEYGEVSFGRDLFNRYMRCMIKRACALVTQGPSKLTWQAPTAGWIQIHLDPWNRIPYTSIPFNLYYGNNNPCPVTLSDSNTTANFRQQLSACIYNDSQVVVLSNVTNKTVVDIVFNNHIGPMPILLPDSSFVDLSLSNLSVATRLESSSALTLMPVNDVILNPQVPEDFCNTCWLDFLQNCLLDATCNAYINCMMQNSYESIATLIASDQPGAKLDLAPTILSCSDPSVPLDKSWRALQSASHCYSVRNCHVAASQNSRVYWQVPNRTQFIQYTTSNPPEFPPSFVFKHQMDSKWNVMYGDINDFGQILPALLGYDDAIVSPLSKYVVDEKLTFSWTITYPAYAGHLPAYYIEDMNGIPVQIMNDPPQSAFLVVRNITWNATDWNSALF